MIFEELAANVTVAAAGGNIQRRFSAGVAKQIYIRATQAVALVETTLAVEIRCGGKSIFVGTLQDLITISNQDGAIGVSTLQTDVRLPIGAWDTANSELTISITNNDAANAFAVYLAVGYDSSRGRRLSYQTITLAAGGVVNMPNVLAVFSFMTNSHTTTDDFTLTVGTVSQSLPIWVGYELYNKSRTVQDTNRAIVYSDSVGAQVNIVHVGAGAPVLLFVQEA